MLRKHILHAAVLAAIALPSSVSALAQGVDFPHGMLPASTVYPTQASVLQQITYQVESFVITPSANQPIMNCNTYSGNDVADSEWGTVAEMAFWWYMNNGAQTAGGTAPGFNALGSSYSSLSNANQVAQYQNFARREMDYALGVTDSSVNPAVTVATPCDISDTGMQSINGGYSGAYLISANGNYFSKYTGGETQVSDADYEETGLSLAYKDMIYQYNTTPGGASLFTPSQIQAMMTGAISNWAWITQDAVYNPEHTSNQVMISILGGYWLGLDLISDTAQFSSSAQSMGLAQMTAALNYYDGGLAGSNQTQGFRQVEIATNLQGYKYFTEHYRCIEPSTPHPTVIYDPNSNGTCVYNGSQVIPQLDGFDTHYSGLQISEMVQMMTLMNQGKTYGSQYYNNNVYPDALAEARYSSDRLSQGGTMHGGSRHNEIGATATDITFGAGYNYFGAAGQLNQNLGRALVTVDSANGTGHASTWGHRSSETIFLYLNFQNWVTTPPQTPAQATNDLAGMQMGNVSVTFDAGNQPQEISVDGTVITDAIRNAVAGSSSGLNTTSEEMGVNGKAQGLEIIDASGNITTPAVMGTPSYTTTTNFLLHSTMGTATVPGGTANVRHYYVTDGTSLYILTLTQFPAGTSAISAAGSMIGIPYISAENRLVDINDTSSISNPNLVLDLSAGTAISYVNNAGSYNGTPIATGIQTGDIRMYGWPQIVAEDVADTNGNVWMSPAGYSTAYTYTLDGMSNESTPIYYYPNSSSAVINNTDDIRIQMQPLNSGSATTAYNAGDLIASVVRIAPSTVSNTLTVTANYASGSTYNLAGCTTSPCLDVEDGTSGSGPSFKVSPAGVVTFTDKGAQQAVTSPELQSQTITLNVPTPLTFGGAPVTVTATASSGLAVSLSVTGPATLSGTTLTVTGVGTVTVTANQAGNSVYQPASAVSQTIVVGKAVPTLSLTTSNAYATVGAGITLTASLASTAGSPTGTISFLDGSTVLNTTAVGTGTVTYSTSALAAGTHNLYASYSGDTNFSAVTSTAQVETISPATANSVSLLPVDVLTIAQGTLATSGGGSPVGTLVDTVTGSGNVYIMDATGSQIYVYNSSTGFNTTPWLPNNSVASASGSQKPCTGGFNNYGDGCPIADAYGIKPYGMAIDSVGNLYIAETGHTAVHVVIGASGAGTVLTNLMTALGISANNSLQPGVYQPGYMYMLVGGGNYTIGTAAGYYCGTGTTVAPTSGVGMTLKSLNTLGDGCLASQVHSLGSSSPRGVAVDSYGNLYISDYEDYAIRMVVANPLTIYGTTYPTGTITTIAGLGKWGGSTATGTAVGAVNGYCSGSSGITMSDTAGDGCLGNQIALGEAASSYPWGVAADNFGNVYFADTYQLEGTSGSLTTSTHGLVRKLTPSAAPSASANVAYTVTDVAGLPPGLNTTICSAKYDSNGDGCPALQATLYYPRGLSVDAAGNLYFSDYQNYLVRRVDASSGRIASIAGGASAMPGTNCAVNSNSTVVASSPVPGDAYGAGCLGVELYVHQPQGQNGVDAQGNVYVINSGSGYASKVAQYPVFANTATGSTSAAIPVGVLFNTGGTYGPASSNTFAAGSNQFNITYASPATSVTGTGTSACISAANMGTGGYLKGLQSSSTVCHLSATFTPTLPGLRSAPLLAVDSNSSTTNLFLMGTGTGAAAALDPALQTTIGSGFKPSGVATDNAGNIYIADDNGNQVVEFSGSTQTTVVTGLSTPGPVAVAANGNVYVADSSNVYAIPVAGAAWGSRIVLSNAVSAPQGLALDARGNLYVADTGHSQILVLPNDNGIPGTAVSTVLNVTGATLNAPTGIAVDAAGNIFIANAGNSSIVEVPASGASASILATGVSNLVGLALDAADNIYYSQSNGVVGVVYAGSSTATTLYSSGVTTPAGIALDGSSNLYVADATVGDVVEFERGQSLFNFGLQTVSTASAAQNVKLTSAGNAALTLSSASQTDAGDFSIAAAGSNGCAYNHAYAAGFVCFYAASFTPTTTGSLQDVVTLNSNAASTPTITAKGTGRVLTASSTTTLSSSTANVNPGQAVTLTATVTGSGVTPTGTVTFAATSTGATQGTLATATLVNGVATYYGLVYVGSDTITATYSGDTNYSGSASNAVTIVNAAIVGKLTFNWPYISFGQSVAYGASSGAWPVTLQNQTGVTVVAPSLIFSGAGAANFQIIGNTCTSALIQGATCSFNVVFSPTTGGSIIGANTQATLTASTSTSSNYTGTLAVSGTAISSALTFNWPFLNFTPSIPVGVISSNWPVTLTNQSGSGTTLASPAVTFSDASFAIVSDGCSGQTLAAGASCTFAVNFSPLASEITLGGTKTISGTMTASGNSGAITGTLPVSGWGAAALSFNWPFVNFQPQIQGSIGSNLWPVTVTNYSGQALTGITYTFTGVSNYQAGAFTLTNTCSTLAAGASCTFDVAPSPVTGQSAGGYSATLVVAGTSGAKNFSSYALTVSGQVISGGYSINWNQDQQAGVSTIDFGPQNTQNVTAGPWPITVFNNTASTETLTLTPGLSVFTTSASNCTNVPSGGSCTFNLSFTPTAVQSYRGTLQIAGGGYSYTFNTWGQATH
jgi:hypothetical protein